MNIKGKTNLIVLGIIAIVGIGALVYFTSLSSQVVPDGGITNGFWNEEFQECRSAPDRPTGVPYIPDPDDAGISFRQCCFNLAGQQIDCNNPDTVLGPFAIYQGLQGIFSVTHQVTITNSGNIDLSNAWIESATWSPSNAVLTAAYAGMLGSANGVALVKTAANDWSSAPIDLQAIGGAAGATNTYDLSLTTKASAVGLPDGSRTTPAQITVVTEEIGFDVIINLGV